MKKALIIIVLAITIICCIEYMQEIKTDYDITEAETILKRAWKPVREMTNSNLETRPVIPLANKEEFYGNYDFTYMDEIIRDAVYDTLVKMGEDHKEVKDKNNNLVFGDDNFLTYIPTIYDEGVVIKKAYTCESRYAKKPYRDGIELVIEEVNNEKICSYATGFSRKNIFRQNEHGEWILEIIEGTLSISWNR